MRVSRAKRPEPLQGLHIASLTSSESVVLNLEQLQRLQNFSYEVVFVSEPELRILAYEHNSIENCYIMIVPLCFYESTKNRSRSFVQLLCLYSQSLTLPSHSPHLLEFQQLLAQYSLPYHKKRGAHVVKFYIEGECWSSYLDFVTSQAVQYKAKNSKELIAMKKHNAYEFCLNAFKEQLLPDIYQNSQDSIENALQFCLAEIKELYHLLACFQRFGVIYEVMKQQGGSFSDLLSQIQLMATAKNITTVADEQCEELINEEISIIVKEELEAQEKELNRMKPLEQQVFLVKILANLLEKLRSYHFDITDQKYLFLASKMIEKVYELHHNKGRTNLERQSQLERAIEQKDRQVQKLKRALQEGRTHSSAHKESNLAVIREERQQEIPTKRVHSENENAKAKLTLRDLKQPLQVISTNVSSDKLVKIPLSKAKQKLKQGLRRREEQKSSVLKSLGKV